MSGIKVMPDYGCFPLWVYGESEVGNIDPSSLQVSSSLVERLNEWASDYDKTLNLESPQCSGFSSKEAETEFVICGLNLAKELKTELAGVQVFYFDIRSLKVSVI